MQAALTFFRLVALTMATLSLLPLVAGLGAAIGGPEVSGPIIAVVRETVPLAFSNVIAWHHDVYWNAARALGIVHGPLSDNLSLYVLIHGTNVLLGALSLRSILRSPSADGAIAIGPKVFPYIQQAALWLLNAITAGVLGNYVYDLIKGG